MESALENNPEATGLIAQPVSAALTDRNIYPGTGAERWWFRLTHWETWDWRIKYLLIAPAWFWFCLRARSLWFFTSSNPTLTFGGFEGESKKEMYDQLPPGSFPKSIYSSHRLPFAALKDLVEEHLFEFPFVVKPDIGKMGLMFRKIHSYAELESYHGKIKGDYIIQEYVSYPVEVSVFYYRSPDEKTGTITGFVRKDYLEITGDGKSTLLQLILKYPRVQFRIEEMKAKHKKNLHRVLPAGEKYCLCPALNLSRGGKLVSLENEKDESLLKVFDDISHYTGNFFYGRYDIKCRSIRDLKEGKHFSILEYNGSGAEPHHVYGNGYSLRDACRILVAHWQVLFRISRINHRKGLSYWDFNRGWHFLKRSAQHLRELQRLDASTPIT